MKESKLMKIITTAVAVCAFAIPGIAAADDVQLHGKSEKVSFSDLNVMKETDVKQLYRRLRHASERVCAVESLSISGSVARVAESRRCYRSTMDSAVARFDSAMLTKIHKG